MFLIFRYVPPINASSPNLPEAIEDIQLELRKQESLLSQIHSEMNAGLHSKKREEELWETQRIITQLKVIATTCSDIEASSLLTIAAETKNV